ncbi:MULTISPECIES: sterol desaturase family protein [unclassified Cupriavidus]|uniref:sterol desaturase family protein n=1 Tax=unclassified Cupriavidus TaxID=2640874 RepID=UPI001C0065F8|nr:MULTISPECIES: sterol desaturase family protein [unclassified Cupriavidus]MCA3186998.1 sterol desaturase family protein [Cupriavidus sp.]MCA3192009.1 sterol desaturase family protein [Cupriavidus sp.]MCA3197754.1 sterol desaturase family protein [Cupriavidus sp.]MCA3202806.1 sterol desaturase family protein [Cupriavidus sp.]MCA3207710.1 sterol desaturase family protein [Cupriavidus sp.]
MQLHKVTLLATGIIVAASMVEAAFLARRARQQGKTYPWHEMGLSLVDMIGRKLMAFLPLSLAAPIFALAWQHRIFTVEINSALAVLLLFIGQEFCYYWYHRASHRIRFFWATHAVHHSPNELTLGTAYRLGWTGKITGTAIFFAPLVFLGVRPEVVLATLSLNLLYQFWLHTTWIPKLGWFEYVFNTPSAHRVHHASNVDYLDANYGGVLIIFDRLFGTYVAERGEEPCRFGLVHPTTTHNPLVNQFEHWISLGKDMMASGNLPSAVGYLLMPPGWAPNGQGTTTEELRQRHKLTPDIETKVAVAQ